jgi:enamine deaminase RidA (YjgF/YER057c/UK114 family)
MEVDFVNPTDVHKPVGYTHVVSLRHPGKLLWISGQVAKDQQGNIVGVRDLEAQTRQAYENLSSILKSMGATFSDIVKMNIYTTRLDQIASIRKVRDQYFSLDRLPATTLVGVSGLADKDFLIEIEAIASLPR